MPGPLPRESSFVLLWRKMLQLVIIVVTVVTIIMAPSANAFGSPSFYSGRQHPPTTTIRRFMAPPPPPFLPNFCADCGNADMVLQIPKGEDRLRACCDQCGRIDYQNPKIVVSCVVRTTFTTTEEEEERQRILLAKRAIEPRRGTWGIPQGYMEHGETTRQAAVREVYEETGVVLDPSTLLFRAVYNVPGSVQLVYEAGVEDPAGIQETVDAYNRNNDSSSNRESLEVALLSEEELKEKELCFPTVQWALDHCRSQSTTSANSAAGASSSTKRIQQMTKLYDAEKEIWTQFEDEVPY